MLASSTIIEINNKYNEALLNKHNNRTACIDICKLGRTTLTYIVGQNGIELGLKDKSGTLSVLDAQAISLLKAGYSGRPKLLQMIDIAVGLNTHSKLDKEH